MREMRHGCRNCGSLRRLLAVQGGGPPSRGVQLRWSCRPAVRSRRLADLTHLDEPLHVYPSVRQPRPGSEVPVTRVQAG